MMTDVADPATVARALAGGAVALVPTDTVYGLAVHPQRPEAVAALFALKGRPDSRPLPVMVADAAQVAALGAVVTPAAERLLASDLVPGALTLVLPLAPTAVVPWLRDRGEVGIRCPAEPWLLALLRETGPLLVTSANAHGQPTPAEVVDILPQLTAPPGVVVAQGPRPTVPSTVVHCGVDPVRIERAGCIPEARIREILA